MKLVSIVVPVYNAEKKLGYCINSILSQTYSELELILVNDGSTDESLKICNNYAEIDDRVKVISTVNRGVSRARNEGISYASGEYLQFVDSDDRVALNMVELMVEAMETYKKDIVFCGMKVVEIENNKPIKTYLCISEGIGRECVLERKIFMEKMGFLLWKTALLEGPCNKIYKLKIVRNHNIKFPVDISLGEDFLMNLQYYEHCNGAVFLAEKLYYYVQSNKNALTKIYRENLFENQLMLIKEFEKFLDKNTPFNEMDRVSVYEYTVAKAMQCLCNPFSSQSELTEQEIKVKIANVINNKTIRNAIEKSQHIDQKYLWIRQAYEFSDVGYIYSRLLDISGEKKTDILQPNERTPGIINRGLVWMLNQILKVFNIRVVEMVRNTLIDFGIVTTLKKSIGYFKSF